MTLTKKLEKIAEITAELQKHRPISMHLSSKPLTEINVKKFEEDHDITLPDGYREFLLHFGDEAVLPHVAGSRMLPLSKTFNAPIYQSFQGSLNSPFKYSGKKPIALEWDDEKDDYAKLDPLEGTLCLGSDGGDFVRIIVITGKDAGKVWTFGPSASDELEPTGMEFIDWVLDGLQEEVKPYQS